MQISKGFGHLNKERRLNKNFAESVILTVRVYEGYGGTKEGA